MSRVPTLVRQNLPSASSSALLLFLEINIFSCLVTKVLFSPENVCHAVTKTGNRGAQKLCMAVLPQAVQGHSRRTKRTRQRALSVREKWGHLIVLRGVVPRKQVLYKWQKRENDLLQQ